MEDQRQDPDHLRWRRGLEFEPLDASVWLSLGIGFTLCLAETTPEWATTTLFVLSSLFLTLPSSFPFPTLDSVSNALALVRANELDANFRST